MAAIRPLAVQTVNEEYIEKMKDDNERLNSFSVLWNRDEPPKKLMADAGFFNLRKLCSCYGPYGVWSVMCAFCGGKLQKLRATDEPMQIHRSLFPRCPFVMANDSKNIALDVTSGEPER